MQRKTRLEKKSLLSLRIAVFCLVMLPFGVSATLVSWGLLPDSQTVDVGQPFQLDLVVSGLGDGIPPSLEGFDVDITFSNNFTIDPNSVVFGTSLGDPNDPAQTQTTSSLIGQEVLFLQMQSFLTASNLDGIQGSSISLATMTFTGSAVGTYLFSGDDFSGGLFLTDGTSEQPGITNAYVTVQSVPEPSTILLLVGGLGIMLGLRKKSYA